MKRSVFTVAMSLLLFAVLTSCEEKTPFPGYKPTGTGLYYKEIVKNEGEQLKNGDVVKINLAYYVMIHCCLPPTVFRSRHTTWSANPSSKATCTKVSA